MVSLAQSAQSYYCQKMSLLVIPANAQLPKLADDRTPTWESFPGNPSQQGLSTPSVALSEVPVSWPVGRLRRVWPMGVALQVVLPAVGCQRVGCGLLGSPVSWDFPCVESQEEEDRGAQGWGPGRGPDLQALCGQRGGPAPAHSWRQGGDHGGPGGQAAGDWEDLSPSRKLGNKTDS